MNKRFILILVAFLTILNSCEWEPTGVYDNEVDLNVNPPEISIVQLSFTDDTLFIYANSQINFQFNSLGIQKIQKIDFHLNGVLYKSINSNMGLFELKFDDLVNGTNTMKVSIYTNSGTGSIADILGAEGFVLTDEKEWIIKAVKEIYSHTVSFNNSNGYLNLIWPVCPFGDFDAFQLRLMNGEIVNTINPSIVDSSYIGLSGNYSIYVVTKSGWKYHWAYNTKVADPPLFKIDNSEGIKIYWTKSNYSNSIEKYILTSYVDNTQVILKETTNPSDTMYFLEDYVFGNFMSFELSIFPKNTYLSGDLLRLHASISQVGEESPVYYDVNSFYTVNSSEFLFQEGNKIKRYSATEKEIVEERTFIPNSCTNYSSSVLGSLFLSPNGKYLTTKLNCNSVILISGSNFSSSNTIDLPNYSDGNFNIAPVSDNGIGILKNLSNNNLVFYDLINQTNMGELSIEYFQFNKCLISSNGQYFTYTVNNSWPTPTSFVLSTFQNGIFSTICELNSSKINYFRFSPTNSDQLVLFSENSFSIKNCSDFSTVSEFQLFDNKVLDVDFFNNQVLTQNYNKLFIRDLYSGNILFEMNVISSFINYDNNMLNGFGRSSFRVLNNTIFHAYGICRRFEP